MDTKACNWCGEAKPLADYGRDRRRPDGHRDECRECRNAYSRERRDPEKRREYERRWRERNPAKARAKKARNHARRMERDPEHVRALARERSRRWRERNPDKVRERNRRFRKENPERVAELKRDYNARNPDAVRRWGVRRRQDVKYRLDAAIRSGVHRGLTKGAKKGRSTFDLLGYDRDALARHLEAQFQPGMTWENYGEWHIDHVIPLAAFNYSEPDHIDFRRAWALDNLRPLWGVDNMRKQDSLPAPFQPSLQLQAA